LARSPRTLLTKLLHGVLLLCVTWQLTFSAALERPRPASAGNLFYEIHRWIGLATLGAVISFWLWSIVRKSETPFAALFPWLSSRRRARVADDLRIHWASLRRLRLPPPPAEEAPLASAVHGLGLLVALAMGSTGAWLFTMSTPGGVLLEAHKAASNLMWAYLIGHASLAVMHQLAGHPVMQRMFAWRGDKL